MVEVEERCALLLLYVRSTDRARAQLAGQRVSVTSSHLFPSVVRETLLLARYRRPADVHAGTTSHEWDNKLAGLNGTAVGYALCRNCWSPRELTYLTNSQMIFHDFWRILGHRGKLVFVEVVDVVLFAEPVHVAQHLGGDKPKAMFFELSEPSYQRVMNADCVGGISLRDTLGRWATHHNGGQAFRENIACTLFPPHAVLVINSLWNTFCFPHATGRKAGGMGMHLVRSMCLTLPRRDGDGDDDAPEPVILSPDLLASCANVMRRISTGDFEAARELQFHINWMANLRNSMVWESNMHCRKAYDLVHLVHCVSCANYVRGAHDFKAMCLAALRVVVRDKEVFAFYAGLLSERTIPSASTLYRHRLTLHLGWCRFQSEQLARMLDEPLGVTRWGTIDSSLQGHLELVYTGYTTVRTNDLPDLLQSALLMIRECLAGNEGAVRDEIRKLSESLSLLAGAPVGVGVGCQSLSHKLQAIAHSARLAAPSWSAVTTLLSSTCTWTGDLGTECRISLFSGSLVDIYGGWVQDADLDDQGRDPAFEYQPGDNMVAEQGGHGSDGGEFAFGPGAPCLLAGADAEGEPPPPPLPPPPDIPPSDSDYPPKAGPYDMQCESSIYIPGMLHIVHNITKDMGTALVEYEAWLTQLTHICRMLSRKDYRQRFMATCLNATAAGRAHKSDFEGFSAHVQPGRWGTVFAAVGAVLGVRVPLQAFWSKERYQGGGRVGQEDVEQGSHTVQTEHIHAGISSKFFWAYASMVDVLGECLEHLSSLSESCPCHHGRIFLYGPTRHLRRKEFAAQHGGVAACPMATRLAPEFASGEHFRVMHTLSQYSHTTLLYSPDVQAVTPEERAKILTEFARGRRHVLFNLRLKLGFWRQLPWIFMALGHADTGIARNCCRRGLQLYDASPAMVHHWVTRLLCDPAGPGRSELMAFIDGREDLLQCPLLVRMAARFRFAAVSERWIEGRHAQAKAHLRSSRNASIVHTAFQGLGGWGRSGGGEHLSPLSSLRGMLGKHTSNKFKQNRLNGSCLESVSFSLSC